MPFGNFRNCVPYVVGVAMIAVSAAASAASWVYVANADSQEISVLQLVRAAGTL